MDSGFSGDLPCDVLEKLRVLDLELAEGDITEKGYEKKKRLLLESYVVSLPAIGGNNPSDTCVAREHSDEPPKNHAIDIDSALDDLGPEPSAADVVDFLDFLPSPSHSPVQSHRDVQRTGEPMRPADAVSVHTPHQYGHDPRLQVHTQGMQPGVMLSGQHQYHSYQDSISQSHTSNAVLPKLDLIYTMQQPYDCSSPHTPVYPSGGHPSRPSCRTDVARPSSSGPYGVAFPTQSSGLPMHSRSQSSRTNMLDIPTELGKLKKYPSSVPNLGLSQSSEWGLC
ncbi:hypothetical protein DFQ28_001875 [Apophysomyces sp. BC1034]|nr:hypothetical protein DFQ29_001279 [Apophysomyces sp. BC1021]KAG0190582.1 hypothetical protein DFQ28_001875 [Apophysomyces sp. BC1034]